MTHHAAVGNVPLDSDSFGPPEINFEELKFDKTNDLIGQGAFGKVYRGKCRGKEVAIKILRNQDLSPETLDEFHHEIEICSRIHHPNVCLFMGACMQPGRLAFVTEFMEGGTLSKLLYDKDHKLTLSKKIKMAKDMALGLNWLHRSNPPIIHRDLKPDNLLVDKYGNIKVTDFGLSDIKRGVVRDEHMPKGSLLWMAPEVMQGLPLTEKVDVYAFALVLWEMITLTEPFLEVDVRDMYDEIAVKGSRPPMPEDIPNSLRFLLQRCWAQKADSRPGFDEVIQFLDVVLIDVTLQDPICNRMWKKHFLGKTFVPWENFYIPLFNEYGVVRPLKSDVRVECMRRMLTTKHPDTTLSVRPDIIELDMFGVFMSTFGQLLKGSDLITVVCDIAKNKWYHGDISRETAETLLKTTSPGYFLVRMSTTSTGFTISKISKSGALAHQRLELHGGKFGDGKKIFGEMTLPDFINKYAAELYLITACPGSRFEELFSEDAISVNSGYITTELGSGLTH